MLAQTNAFRLAEKRVLAWFCRGLPLPIACGMIAATGIKAASNAAFR